MHRNDGHAEDALPVRSGCRPPLRRANPNMRGPRQCGTLARSPLPLIPSPSGEGTGAVSLPRGVGNRPGDAKGSLSPVRIERAAHLAFRGHDEGMADGVLACRRAVGVGCVARTVPGMADGVLACRRTVVIGCVVPTVPGMAVVAFPTGVRAIESRRDGQ